MKLLSSLECGVWSGVTEWNRIFSLSFCLQIGRHTKTFRDRCTRGRVTRQVRRIGDIEIILIKVAKLKK